MRILRALSVLAVLSIVVPSLRAAELGIKAPPLKIAEWIKGQPVDVTVADGKSVFVVEFWATWCGPCKMSIPHLTEMQKKYKDKNVTFIGVSDEAATTIKPFVEKQGDKMDYVVAADQNKATSVAYMAAFGQGGIPTAFIIDQKGRIVWFDHPMAGIDKVIDEILAGKFDLEKAKLRKAVFDYVDGYLKIAVSAGDLAELAPLGDRILVAGADNPELMSRFALMILKDRRIVRRDKAFALKVAEIAIQASEGKDPNVLDAYALALFENEKKAEAIAAQTKAIELAQEQKLDQKAIDGLTQRLTKYKGE